MAEEIRVAAVGREEAGSADARRLRRAGWLPAVISNEKGQSRLIKLNLHDFDIMLQHHTSDNLMINVDVDGNPGGKVLLKEVQHHPVSGEVLHVDFVEVSMTRKMRVEMPVALSGEPVGVTQEGGILEQMLREVEVECLPGDLVEQFEVDVSHLGIGDALMVGDLNVSNAFTVITAPDVAVAAVVAPRVEEEEVPAEEVEEAVEGEEVEGAEGGAKAEEDEEKKEKE
jgi:large subunit ribosomal protein L25